MRIRDFRDLDVWKNAMDAAMRIFELTKRFPPEERYAMTDQIRRSSRSVAAHVSEAWGKRRWSAAFVAKLHDATSEASETRTWLEFARRCGYLDAAEVAALDETYSRITAQLITMAANPDKWTTGEQP